MPFTIPSDLFPIPDSSSAITEMTLFLLEKILDSTLLRYNQQALTNLNLAKTKFS